MVKLIIDCISDTHCKHAKIKLPGGDILIHSGDATSRGDLSETLNFLDWFGDQDYSYRVLVPGNHDFIFEQNPALMADECKVRGIILLNDSGTAMAGLNVWGSAITPWFYDWAFNRQRGAEIKKHWDLIPNSTDILVTHGPPYRILDEVPNGGGSYKHVGCEDLLTKICETTVKLHVFGHIHEGAGVKDFDGRTFVNASSLNGRYDFKTPGYRRIIKEESSYYEEVLRDK